MSSVVASPQIPTVTSPKRSLVSPTRKSHKLRRKFVARTPVRSPNANHPKQVSVRNVAKDIELSAGKEHGSIKTKRNVKPSVERVYSMIRKRFGTLGGGGAGGAIYGELTISSFQNIVDFMKAHCELDESSCFIDVGSGLGKPNFHVGLDANVRLSVGVELGGERWWQSMILLSETEGDMCSGNVFFAHADVFDMPSFQPFTHVYMFDKGFPPYLLENMSLKFNSSDSCRYLICYKKPKLVMEEYEFNVELVGQLSTNMSGSGEGNSVYFYRKKHAPERSVKSDLPNFGWVVPPTPKDASVAAPVGYSDTYGDTGLHLLYAKKYSAYQAWVVDQVGMDRAKRCTRTRRSCAK
jgi:hypothetical protein